MSIEFRNASKEVIAFFANIDTEKANRVVLYTVALDVESIEDADGRQYVQAVRCRDCAYRGWSEAGGHFCARGIGLTVEPDGFCAWGERREP